MNNDKIAKIKKQIDFYKTIKWSKFYCQNDVDEVLEEMKMIENLLQVANFYEINIKGDVNVYDWSCYVDFYNEIFNQLEGHLDDMKMYYEDWK